MCIAENQSTLDLGGALSGAMLRSSHELRCVHLLADPTQRQARAEEKRRQILRLLRDEIWTTTDVVALLLCVGYAGAHNALKIMQKQGLTSSAEVFIPGKRGAMRTVLHGITAQGLAYAWDLDEEPESRTPWEPSKTNPLFVPHQIDTQKVRIKAEQHGWRGWKPARSLMRLGLPKLPDAEAASLDGERIAIEIEREIKTDKRYQAVIGAYVVQMKKDQRWQRVDYLCPDENFAARLARIFGRLQQIRLEGKQGQAGKTGALTQPHLDRFRFYALDEWPTGKFITSTLREAS